MLIEVVEHADGVTICAVYPDVGTRPNECLPGEDGRMRVRDNDVQVDFAVRVPAGVRFVPRTVNGTFDVRDVEGDVDAHTVNGGIDVSAAGVVRAQTVNGAIDAVIGRSDWDGTVHFATVNGSITVTLPDGVSAAVVAEAVNGSLTSDFPLTVSGRFGPRRMQGRIGDDSQGRSLELTTVNGGVHLRRAF